MKRSVSNRTDWPRGVTCGMDNTDSIGDIHDLSDRSMRSLRSSFCDAYVIESPALAPTYRGGRFMCRATSAAMYWRASVSCSCSGFGPVTGCAFTDHGRYAVARLRRACSHDVNSASMSSSSSSSPSSVVSAM